MKKLIINLIVSAPLFFITPSFAASSSTLYNPELRTDTMSLSGVNAAVPKAGATYAYWHRGHWHHRYHYYKPWRHGYYGHRYYHRHYRYHYYR